MYKMKGLGRNIMKLAAFVAVLGLPGGCCNYGYRCGNPCEWPSGSIELGLVPLPMFGKGCGSCGKVCDPCYPFNGKGTTPAANSGGNGRDWGYDNSDYLSSADQASSGSSYY